LIIPSFEAVAIDSCRYYIQWILSLCFGAN